MPDTMIRVKAMVEVYDNGVRHAPGEEFEMEESLVGPHAAAGQVERIGGPKQAAPAADKQQRGGADK